MLSQVEYLEKCFTSGIFG